MAGFIYPTTTYYNNLISVVGGSTYISDAYGNTSTAGSLNSSTIYSLTNPVSMTFLNLGVYGTDGSTLSYLNVATGNMVVYTPSSGSITPTFCSQIATWRGRLILYQDANNPQNIYATRTGAPTDWNYAATDPAAAWAANFSQSGQIGQPVVSFIPFNNDIAVVACIDQMWLIEGDPSDGGSFVLMSDHMGMLGPNAWCTDPAHTLYFVGTSGLYSLRPFWAQYQPPQLLTGQLWDQYFQSLDRNTNRVSLIYDEVNKFIHIYVTPSISTEGAGEHLLFDTRNGGLWPVTYALTAGPTATASFTPGSPGVKQIISLGGYDGNIYKVDANAVTDFGNAIVSFITFPPVNPSPLGEAILNRVEVDMGEIYSTYTNVSTTVIGAQISDGTISTGWSSNGHPSTGLIGTVNGSNVTFTLSMGTNIANINQAFYILSTGAIAAAFPAPTLSGTNVITLPHPVVSTYTLAGFMFESVGFYIQYDPVSLVAYDGWNANFAVQAGAVAADVSGDFLYPTGDPTTNLYQTWDHLFTLDRRQPVLRPRLNGAWFGVTLSNSTASTMWSFERAILNFTPGGLNRRQR
jgi:hypothetical protein